MVCRPADLFASVADVSGTSLGPAANLSPDRRDIQPPPPAPTPEELTTSTNSGPSIPIQSATGRLKSRFEFWKYALKANKFILNMIDFGYAIPFVSLPGKCMLRNNASSLKQEHFVRAEINALLSKGYIEEMTSPSYCCNPLTVVVGRKMRLILDLRHVNQHVRYLPIKYDDWSALSQTVEQDNFFVSFDLTQAYHHVSILPAHRKYLGFSFNYPSDRGFSTRYFQFNVLVFGLCSACHAFTKLTRPLVAYWRGMGILSYIYIDDGIGVFNSKENAISQSRIMLSTIESSGFIINAEKSNWVPAQTLDWLGFHFNSTTMQISVSHKKIEKVMITCYNLLNKKTVSPRHVAALIGQIIAMQRAIGPESRLMTRFLSFWVDRILKNNIPEVDAPGVVDQHGSNFMDHYSAMIAPGVVDQHGSNFMDHYSAMNAPGVVDQHGSNFMDHYSATIAPGVVDQQGSNCMDHYSAMNAPGVVGVVDQHGSNFTDHYSAMNAPGVVGVVDQHGSNYLDQYSAMNAPGVVDQHGSNCMDQHTAMYVPNITGQIGANCSGNLHQFEYNHTYLNASEGRIPATEVRNPRLWDLKRKLTNVEKFEIKFWLDNISRLNGRALWDQNTFDAICFSDASNEGFAGYISTEPGAPFRERWNPHECKFSSTWRELTAISRSLVGLQQTLKGKCIKWCSDSQGAVSILRHGSKNMKLHSIARQIAAFCQDNSVTIAPQWIPRGQNTQADEYSRWADKDDWSLAHEHFAALDARWGPHTVDRFSNDRNAKCSRFDTKLPCSTAESIDAFSQAWGADNNWLCPPVRLIPPAIAHARKQRASGTIIVPYWPSSYFWPIIMPDGVNFASFVEDYVRFYGQYDVGNPLNTCVFNSEPAFDTLALRFNFSSEHSTRHAHCT